MKIPAPVFALLLTAATLRAGDAAADWKALTALDAGPQEQPQTAEAARATALAHLARQERALRGFLAAHPGDARAFEAQLRLARLFQIRGDLEESDKLRAEGRRLLAGLEQTATAAQRVELEFAKIALLMRDLREFTPARRDALLAAARRFEADYPADRRVAALLAEVATLFDKDPRTKEALLLDAQPRATDPELKARIADDLRRVRLLGAEVPLSFTSVQGREVRLADLRGQPVLVVFFAAFSPPSLAALATIQRTLLEIPAGRVAVVAVCLDEKRETLDAVMKTRGVTWPVAFDGKGWESPLVRELGINKLPTVWLLDARGRLRSLAALDGLGAQIQHLLRER